METSRLSTFAADLFVGRTSLIAHGGLQIDSSTPMPGFKV